MEGGQFKVHYRFVGGYCCHQHPAPQMSNPFDAGWEMLTLCFRASDWFSGPVNAWVKNRCAELGIPWLDFAPRDRPKPDLAAMLGGVPAAISEEEQRQPWRPWAALEQGGSIFDDAHCSTPWCGNYDPVRGLLSALVDVVVHAPGELIDALLSSLYDWNHGLVPR